MIPITCLFLICKYRQDKHVRVIGDIKTLNERRYINVLEIRKIRDPHEVFYHILESIMVTLITERGPVSLRFWFFLISPILWKPPSPILPLQPNPVPDLSRQYATQTNSTTLDHFSRLPNIQRNIIGFMIDQPPTNEGVHISSIAKAMGEYGDNNVDKIRYGCKFS